MASLIVFGVSIFTSVYQWKQLNEMIFAPIGVLRTSKKLSHLILCNDNLTTIV